MAAAIFDGLPNLFTECLGEPVVYTPIGGDPVTISAIVIQDSVLESFNEPPTNSLRKVIGVRTADVPNIAENDGITFGGADYHVVQPINPDGKGMTSLMLAAAS